MARPDDQDSPTRVAFDVTAHRQEVLVVLDGKALKTSLIEMSFACIVIMRVVTLRVGRRDPAKHPSHLTILLRTDDEVPKIRHQRIGKKLDVISLESFTQNTLKRSKVFRLMKDFFSRVATVERVIDSPSNIQPFLPRHRVHR